jgi:hypothetical protein
MWSCYCRCENRAAWLSNSFLGRISERPSSILWGLIFYGSKGMGKPAPNANNGQKTGAVPDPTASLSAVHFTLDLYKRQLLPGQRLDLMSNTLLGNLNGLICK